MMESENIQIRGKQEILKRKEFFVFLTWVKDFKSMLKNLNEHPQSAAEIKGEVLYFLDMAKKYSPEDFITYIASTVHKEAGAEEVINNQLFSDIYDLYDLEEQLILDRKDEVVEFRQNIIKGVFGAVKMYNESISAAMPPEDKPIPYRLVQAIEKEQGCLLDIINKNLRYIKDDIFTLEQRNILIEALGYRYSRLEQSNYVIPENWTLGLLNKVIGEDLGEKQKETLSIVRDQLEKHLVILQDTSLEKYAKSRSRDFVMQCRTISKDVEIHKKATDYLNNLLQPFQINVADIEESWFKENKPTNGRFLEENLDRLKALEDVRPGAAKVLHEEFGLTMFKKYPLETLINQYDQKDSDFPYGVYASTIEDNDRAISVEQRFANFKSLSESGNLLRFVEFKSTFSLLRKLVELDRRYGSKNKINFAILSTHGGKDTIVAGGKTNPDIESSDLNDKKLEMLAPLFTEHAHIMLLSCNTGEEGGIAQNLSGIPGVKIIAPNTPVDNRSTEITFDYEEGRPIPRPIEKYQNIYETYSAKSKI